ncbi:Calx-beta domain-containing protein [uncultured Sphingomonas sp.]|uniref:Calx-beta domain-containing protein n=1 Tax=uncultured Sphingomonas sp. TaxID=158754 RepID=UPI0025EEA3DA|nr:Calx-beta domain-containing protein [uncultured Sphingomonas sp.]
MAAKRFNGTYAAGEPATELGWTNDPYAFNYVDPATSQPAGTARVASAAAPDQATQAAAPGEIANGFTFTAGTLTYSENFDSLASSGTTAGTGTVDGGTPLGSTRFVFLEASGTSANTSYSAGNGSVNTGDTYSFGTAVSTDRAIGSLASGGVATIYYGTLFTNDTGSTITSLAIAFTGEQWRAGGRTAANGPDRLDFSYSTTATTIGGTGFTDFNDLDFVSPSALPSTAGALDGNAAANRQAISANLAVEIPAGGSIFIRWADTNVIGNDDGLAIDDFSITATLAGTPQPATETISFATPSITQAEGSGTDTAFTYTLTRTGSTAASTTVAYALATSGNMTDASDFTGPTSGTATFAAGSDTATVTITVAGDRVIEGDETFALSLSNPGTGYVVSSSAGSATGTITNDDLGGTFTIAGLSDAAEGGTTSFTITRTGGDGGPVTIGYTVGAGATGTSADATDFGGSFPSGSVTFAAGETSKTIAIATTDDATPEGDESFTVTLGAPSAGTLGAQASAQGLILASDPAGSVSVADVSVNEGAGVATITLTRTNGTGAITVGYATADGTATAGADYTAASGTATFGEGVNSVSFDVPITNDNLQEADETFTVTLTAGDGAPTIARGTATVTILDNDEPAAVGSFDIAPATSSVREGNSGVTVVSFTVSRTDGTTGAVSIPYTVGFTGTNPADVSDFAAGEPLSGTVTFADGDAATKTIEVQVQGDSTLEADETFTVSLGTPGAGTLGTQASATATILNDDSTFAIAAGRAAEGSGTIPLVVTRSGDLSSAATLQYDVSLASGDTASADDFAGGTLPSGTVSFAAGAATATINVGIANDSAIERDETFTVTLLGAGAGQVVTGAVATGTIVNDDFPALSISDASVIEGNDGVTLLRFTVTASEPAGADGIAFQVSTADGSASAATDYGALSNASATIAAGQTSTIVTVAVNGDTVFERNETLSVTLSNATNATIARGSAIGTIVNDDAVPASARIVATDFGGFTAAGFAPTPGTGQLDSDIWRVVGLSDNTNPAYGATLTTGDFARGTIVGSADPATAGIYSPAANGALVFQATGAEMDAGGYIEARIENTSGATATSFDVAFDWAYRNSADRASSMQLAYSTDGVNYTRVDAAAFTTPQTAPRAANGTTIAVPSAFSTQAEAVTITGTVADGGFLYLRWIHASSAGSGSRDEVGIDNLVVDAKLSSTPTASIADVSVVEGNGGERFATFTVTRSNGTAEASVAYTTVDGSAVAGRDYGAASGTLNFAVGEVSKTIQVAIIGDTVREADERFQLILSNPIGFEVPQPRATATIVNDDDGPVAIYDIQGLGHTSAFAGQVVQTSGVVTALATNGFYLQDAVGDRIDGTSDGIFVFTNAAPNVTVGNAITLSGTVEESRGHNGALTLTRLANPTDIIVTTPSVALPAAVVIATDGSGRAAPTQVIDDDGLTSYDPTSDGIDFYESLEGMLVTIQTPRVVADTTSVGITYVVASDGVGATGLNNRSGMTISAGDNNPETLQIFRGGTHTQGDTLNNVTGVLTYFSSTSTSSGSYQVNPTDAVTVAVDREHPAREATSLTGATSSLSYASFNVENLAPVADSTVEDRNTQDKVDLAFARHAAEIVNALRNPDVIGLQEIQDADGIGTGTNLSGYATAAKLIAAIEAAGGPTYAYVEVTPTENTGGEPGGYIRPGFLYIPGRVTYVEGSARALGDAIYAGTRRPLVADFQFNGQVFTAIDMHSTSRGGSGPLYGSTQPPVQAGDGARTAQALAVKSYIDGVLANDPNHLFMVNGDFNGFPYEAALNGLAPVDGTGALVNLINTLPVEERYTYYFDGYYQSFDNVIVSQRLAGGSSIDVVHYNAGYSDGLSATDHDQPVALIGMARTGGAATAITDNFTVTANNVLHATVLANDTGGDPSLTVSAINGAAASAGDTIRLASGALLTLTTGGGFAYNPDGAYATLGAGQTATDTFSYTLPGGSSATATITITGVAVPAPDALGHIQGTSGNDNYGGTQQADYFDLSAGGVDRVAGGAGEDAFFFGAALTAADRVEGGSGMDQVGIQGDYTGANRLVLNATTLTDVELLAALPGGSYDVVLNAGVTGASGTFTVFGSNLAASNNLTVDGSAVTAGSLMMYGGLGVDTLTGGAGNDGFYFGPDRFGAGDSAHGGGGSNDQVGLDGDYTLTLDARFDVEVVALLAGPASDRNVFNITVSNDFVASGATKTIFAIPVVTALTIDASAETDGSLRIFGGQAGDTITGGAGNDRIFGGEGGDTLRGGAGADVFVYDAANQSSGRDYDRLLDFDYTSDRIGIAGQVHDSYQTVAGGRLDDATFDADLQTALGAQLTGGNAVFFTVDQGNHAGQTFLVVDANGVDGYQAGGDYVFEVPAPPVTVTDFIIA